MPSQFEALRKLEVNKAAANQQPSPLLSATDCCLLQIVQESKLKFGKNVYFVQIH